MVCFYGPKRQHYNEVDHNVKGRSSVSHLRSQYGCGFPLDRKISLKFLPLDRKMSLKFLSPNFTCKPRLLFEWLATVVQITLHKLAHAINGDFFSFKN